MSMHEFEDFVEMAVKRLAQSGLSRQRLRSLYFNLFELEARFDTSFTHFRTMDELLAARYVYCLAPSEHPSFASSPDYFRGLSTFCFVEPPGAEPGVGGGYFKPPHLYCDAGSALWRRLVEQGRLGGTDAEPPEVLPSQEAIEEVARAAEQAGDVVLVAYAYRLLLWDLLDREVAELREDLAVLRLRDIARRTGALNLKFEVGALRDPTPADLAESELVRFWFDIADARAEERRASGSRLRAVRPVSRSRRPG
ncbi:MAG: hypothetical protein EOO73_27285 [Myxococcales bacterium]|nr:MAG: hypothetical protein EOO73_27285 [Myxococcales bacterium]